MARQSSIDKLPKAIREALQALLRDPAVSQLEACKRVNELLDAEGVEQTLSKSAVNRYAMRMEQAGAKIRQSREIAEMWIGKLGSQPQGEVGKLLNEFTRTMAFETAMSLSEDEDPIHPKMLKELSLAIKHLEDAASANERREREIRKQVAEEAAQNAGKAAKAAGLTAESVDIIKAEILGIAR